MAQFRTDDAVLIEYKGQTFEGYVLLASANAKSLMLRFPDRMVAGYIETVPVLLHDDGKYRDLIQNEVIEVEPLSGT